MVSLLLMGASAWSARQQPQTRREKSLGSSKPCPAVGGKLSSGKLLQLSDLLITRSSSPHRPRPTTIPIYCSTVFDSTIL